MTSTAVEQKKNGYEDADFLQVVEELEEMDDECETISATARGKIGAVKTRQKNRIKIAKVELGIPSDVLKAVMKQRKLERQIAKISAGISDDQIELYADAAGQFSWLKPDADHATENAAQTAARQRKADIQKITDQEQADGAAALDELAGAVH
ncbi:hypothetical protein PSQ19_06145 [Devosia algicola]|uniref:Nascent polypeptide-associated complex subunit alpha-like UBA domain-containing protein n=1 Tax=Devosia algicola TaxID=3026418 RepID=A0ABY7YQW1_9HYPH|nr:hypothetical protein [Devosia algicola]WDR03649.1 hypothetical protein PSQ19_06145 [Devosia algicola]